MHIFSLIVYAISTELEEGLKKIDKFLSIFKDFGGFQPL